MYEHGNIEVKTFSDLFYVERGNYVITKTHMKIIKGYVQCSKILDNKVVYYRERIQEPLIVSDYKISYAFDKPEWVSGLVRKEVPNQFWPGVIFGMVVTLALFGLVSLIGG